MMLFRLFPFVGKYKKYAVLTPVCIFAEVVLEILIPFLMARMIDEGVMQKNVAVSIETGAVMIVAALFSLLFGALGGRYAAVSAAGMAKGVRSALFRKIQEFSFANADKFSSASLITRLTTDITFTQMAFMMVIRILVRGPLMLTFATAMTVYINPELSLVFFAAIPVLSVALAFLAMKAHPYFEKMFAKYDAMNAAVQETLIAVRVVKAFVREKQETDKFDFSARDVLAMQRRAEKIISYNMPVMMLSMNACMIAVLYLGGRQVVANMMTAGELVGFINYIHAILISLMVISMAFIGVVISKASVERICEVLNEQSDIADGRFPDLDVKDGSIVFEDVSFSYSKTAETPVLSHVSFDIKSGENIGIVGATGSSKSTLIMLIARLYDATQGRVMVGGNDVRDYALQKLRNSVAVVLQKNDLFSGTIAENLRWGNENASEEELFEAARMADAFDFVNSFPEAFKTVLGRGGTTVSGGQKQRLCIARALLKNPKIIIFDESTSAVDTATDRRIRQALAKKLSDVTRLTIAQRISSVKDCDRILVLHEGKINAFGTHDELMASNEVYRDTYLSQNKEAV